MNKDKDYLGNRMKSYENSWKFFLTPRMPLICRIDGKSFHTYTKGFDKPWDEYLQRAMTHAASDLVSDIQGAELAYIQSDEISILINTYKTFATQQYFDGNVQKIASVAASIATAGFNRAISESHKNKKPALFDARCFAIPREDAVNYFWWRQQDAIRNSVSGFAQANFSHKELHGKSQVQMKEMLKEKGCVWEELLPSNQRGWCVLRRTFTTDGITRSSIEPVYDIPVFSEQRSFFDRYLEQVEV